MHESSGSAWPGYPARLIDARLFARGPAPVDELWLVGELPAEGPRIAIVGGRAASPTQLAQARALTDGLVAAGAVVVSGGAFGIDAQAHEQAARRGGRTVVALPAGVQRPTPKAHTELFGRVLAANGAIISREAPGSEFGRGMYRRRNRVLVAAVDAVVVVCAQRRSGTLITARMAQKAGVDLRVVPWSPDAPCSEGSNGLLAGGARAIWGAEGARSLVAQSLARQPTSRQPMLPIIDGAAEGWQEYAPCKAFPARESLKVCAGDDPALVAAIDRALADRPGIGLSLEELVTQTARPRAVLAATVLNLLMEGQLQRASFGRYLRSP